MCVVDPPTVFATFAAVLALAATPTLEEARAAMKALECRQALELASVAERSPTLSTEERQEAWWIQARCAIALGEHRKSELALGNLLRDDPSFTPAEDDSPKVREAVEKTREALYPKGFVRLESLPSSAVRERFRLLDPFRRVARVELVTRDARDQAFSPQPLAAQAGVYVVEEEAVRERQWFLRAVDAGGDTVASVADAEAPRGRAVAHRPAALVVAPPPVEPKPAPAGLGAGKVTALVLGAAAAVALGVAVGLRVDAQHRYEGALAQPYASDVRAGYEGASSETSASVGLLIAAGALAGAGVTVAVAF